MEVHEGNLRESIEAVASGKLASSEALPLVYDQLRRLARFMMHRQKPGQTLQATALVHEVYLRVLGDDDPAWHGQKHFFRVAAKAMRHILVEDARRKKAEKRGGKQQRVELDSSIEPEILFESPVPTDDILALDEALNHLKHHDPRAFEIVELRYFGGLGIEDIARVLDVSVSTVERDWRFARSYLKRLLTAEA